MKQRIALVLVALAAVVALWWTLAGRESAPTADEKTEDAAPGLDRQAIIDRKMQAREGGEIDLSPARAQGRVTDGEGGRGIPGAIVLLTPKGLDQLNRSMTPGESARPLRVRTTADGTWSIEPVLAGRYSISATARGFLPATLTNVTLVAGEDNGGLNLVLGRGGHEVTGTVSDIGGGPVEDVLIRVARLDDAGPFNFDRPSLGTTTDEEGRFVMQLPDGRYNLRTFHADYVDASKGLRIDGGPRTAEFTITPAGSIEGRVLSRTTGEPVEGAIVSRNGDGGQGFVVQGIGEDQVITDAEGRFRLRGLGSGVVRLGAVARGYATRSQVEVVLGVAEQVTDVEILVDQALTVSGFVVARGDEERGLEGVLVGAFSFQPGRLYVASGPSKSDGYFEIFGVMPGGYTVGAIGEDSLPNLMGASAQVRDEDVRDVLVVMDAGVHVRGRVSPAVPAKISVKLDSENMSMSTMMQSFSNAMVSARTDDEGGFDLHPVAEGSMTLVAEADDGSRGELEIDVAADDLDGLVVELEPRASVSGRVVDASGQPAAGLTVAFATRDEKKGGFRMNFGGGGRGREDATTDESGAFVVQGLDPGDYDVTVGSGRGPTLEWAQPEDPEDPRAPILVTVAEGEQRQGLELAVEARDGIITGVVLGTDGQPVVDAWVTAIRNDSAKEMVAQMQGNRADEVDDGDADEEERERGLKRWEMMGMAEPPVLTDDAGRFEVTDLRHGVYRLRAEAHADGARGFVEEVALNSDVAIELQTLAGLEGVVTFKGKPVKEFTVEVKGPSSRTQQMYAPEGRFEMARLDAGDYEVVARCTDGTARAEVTIVEGRTASVDLGIGGWSTLRGKVLDAGTGDPIAGLSITVMGDGGPSAGSVMGFFTGAGPRTDEDGRFEVGEVPPGEGKVLFFDRDAAGFGGGVVAQADYEVEAESEQDLGTINGVAPGHIPPDERGTLGLTVKVATYAKRPRAPESEDDEEEAAFDKTKRLWVSSVTPDGPAAQEGLVPGDEILSVDGTGVAGMGAVNAAKLLSPQHMKVGEDVRLEIEHDGSRHTVTLTAEARADDDADD